MTCNLKVLGLAVVAILSLSAVVASAASAAIPFTAPEAPTDWTGEQVAQNIFTFEAGEVKCNTAKFSGTVANASETDVTITPTYESCTAFGFATTHFKMNGCTYTFTEATIDLGGGEFEGFPPHLVCPGTNQIEITPTFPIFGGSVCTLKIPPQTPTSGNVLYKNEGTLTERDVRLTYNASGFHYTSTGGPCSTTGVTHTDGKYTGGVTFKGFQDGNHAVRESILLK